MSEIVLSNRSILIDFIAYSVCIEVGYKRPRVTQYYKKIWWSLQDKSNEELHNLYNKFVVDA